MKHFEDLFPSLLFTFRVRRLNNVKIELKLVNGSLFVVEQIDWISDYHNLERVIENLPSILIRFRLVARYNFKSNICTNNNQ